MTLRCDCCGVHVHTLKPLPCSTCDRPTGRFVCQLCFEQERNYTCFPCNHAADSHSPITWMPQL